MVVQIVVVPIHIATSKRLSNQNPSKKIQWIYCSRLQTIPVKAPLPVFLDTFLVAVFGSMILVLSFWGSFKNTMDLHYLPPKAPKIRTE